MNIVEVKDLSKLFKKSDTSVYAVHHVNLTIREGEIMGLVGESGCGKSTFGKLLLKLLQPTGGEIWFDGNNITDYSFRKMKTVRKDMQVVFQGNANAFNPYHTVRQILSEPLDNFTRLPAAEKEKNMIQMLKEVDLGSEYLNRYSGELSGGQRQRVGIARALIINPRFVVCDEAVSSVDYVLRKQILKILYRLKEEKGFTYLFISHDMTAVRAICDRIAVMYLGNMVEILPDGGAEARHPYTKALMTAALSMNPEEKRSKEQLFREDGDFSCPKQGCVFQKRCLYAAERCRKETPKFQELNDGHFVACHLF